MTTPTKDRELLEQAANALEGMYERYAESECGRTEDAKAAAKAIRARLAQPDAIGAAGGEVPEGWTVDEMVNGGFRIVRPSGAWILVQNKPADGWNIVWELLDAMFNRPAAPKSGDMAQGEQETSGLRMELATAMRYIEERDERIKELKAEIANLRFAIERIQTLSVRAAKLTDALLAHPAASTGAGQISDDLLRDAARYRWLRNNHWSDGGGTLCVTQAINIQLGSDVPSTERLDAMIDDAIAAAQPKGDGK